MADTVAERVARGAALLDEKLPGWAFDIDLRTLDITSSCRCVLGQLHGDYGTGMGALFLGEPLTVSHGFFYLTSSSTLIAEDVAALNAEWTRLIEARRSAWIRQYRAETGNNKVRVYGSSPPEVAE